jgi:hypothetical protein
VSTSLTKQAMAAALAPTFYFHPDEQYLPVTMDEFVSHSSLKSSSGAVISSSLASVSALAQATTGSSGEHLEVNSSWASSTGDLSGATIYYNFVEHDGYVDFLYSFLTPYQGCQGMRVKTQKWSWSSFSWKKETSNFAMCNLGRHYGDWEHATVRVNSSTGEVVSVITNAHGDSAAHAPGDVTWSSTHPRIYVALNTHGTYVTEGYHTLWDLGGDTSIWEEIGMEALLDAHGIADNVTDVKVVDLTTTDDLLDSSGGSFQTLDSSAYTLQRIGCTGGPYCKFMGSWGTDLDNSDIDGSVGDIPYVDDADFTAVVQDVADLGVIDDYLSGDAPTGVFTHGWWTAGED